MAKEYKTLTFIDTASGRQKMAEVIDQLARDGWEIKSKETSQQNYSFVNTCCLGCIFLPLALLGKKKNNIVVVMEREISPSRKEESITDGKKEITDYYHKPWYKTWWGILLIIFIGIPMFSGMILGAIQSDNRNNYSNNNSQSQEKAEEDETSSEPLNITASYDYSYMYITNNEDGLTGCTFNLNSDYKYNSGKSYGIEAGQKAQLSLSDFTESDGNRFNIYKTKPKYLYITCQRLSETAFGDIWWD